MHNYFLLNRDIWNRLIIWMHSHWLIHFTLLNISDRGWCSHLHWRRKVSRSFIRASFLISDLVFHLLQNLMPKFVIFIIGVQQWIIKLLFLLYLNALLFFYQMLQNLFFWITIIHQCIVRMIANIIVIRRNLILILNLVIFNNIQPSA